MNARALPGLLLALANLATGFTWLAIFLMAVK